MTKCTRSPVRTGVFLLLLFLLPTLPVIAGATQEGGPMIVYASIPPQAYMVQKIAGQAAQVFSIIQPGQDAHTFDPSPREIQRLGQARVVFITGLEFEKGILDPLSRGNRNMEIVDLRQGIELRALEAHWHDPDLANSHDDGNSDPHIWLGIPQVRIQAQTIRDTLIRLIPEEREEILRGYGEFTREIDGVQAELDELLNPLRGQSVLVYHPAFGYLLDSYEITQLAIEAGGREPSPRLLQQTIEKSLVAGVRIIFTQPEYEDAASRAVARAIGGRAVPISDLGPNWSELLLSIGYALGEVKGNGN